MVYFRKFYINALKSNLIMYYHHVLEEASAKKSKV